MAETNPIESESARRYEELEKESPDPWVDLIYAYADLSSIQHNAGEGVKFDQNNLIARIEHNPIFIEQHERFQRIKKDLTTIKSA